MGSRNLKIVFAVCSLLTVSAQGKDKENRPISNQPAASKDIEARVIYGDDDRLDLYEVEDESTLLLARATATMVRNNKLIYDEASRTFDIDSQIYGEKYRLCEDEPFWTQPIGPSCSGFLVNSTTVVTAGHCVRTQASCERLSFVFDYAYYEGPEETPDRDIPASLVFSCKKLIHSENRIGSSDFAVLTLDRPVTDREPLALNPSPEAIAIGTELFVIGNPTGLPTKLAGGAQVRSVMPEFFKANLDTYHGNSGSAVFNATSGLVEGLLVRGERDLVDSGEGCRVSKRCADDGCIGEDVTKIKYVFPYITAD